MNKTTVCLLGLAVLTGISSGASADEAINPWRFSAYGSLTYSRDDQDHLGFVRDLAQAAPRHAGGSLRPDSRMGLQVNYRINADTEAVMQAVAREKAAATLGNSIEWAYVAWRPSATWQARLGRVGADIFLLSDYRNLGYAQTTVRPNWEFYGFLPIYTVDGGDLTYKFDDNAVRWSLKAQAGRTGANVPVVGGDIYRLTARNFKNLTLTRETDQWRIKAGAATMTLDREAPFSALTNELVGVAANPAVPANIRAEAADYFSEIRFKDVRINYLTLGAAYDDGLWQAQGEISKISSGTKILIPGVAAYAQVGRRFGQLLPYVGVSGFSPQYAAVQASNNWAPIGASALQAGAVRALNSTRIDQRTVTLGLRWDFHPLAAAKLQWNRMHVRDNGYGLWETSPPYTARKVNQLSVGIDWVF